MAQKPRPRLPGVIIGWHPGSRYGFADSDGTEYYISRDDLPRGHRELPVGTTVTFIAGSAPEPGHDHLRARSVRIEGITAPNGRGCDNKTPYSSRPEALSGLQRLADKSGESASRLHVYECDLCGQHHVGHKIARQKVRRKASW